MTIAEHLAVTIEVTGGEFSEAAIRLFAAELAEYEPAAVHGALKRCRRELTTRLTLAAVIERLDDGRPGAEEAWALLPKNEADSAVITGDMRAAMGPALELIAAGDAIAARMAFLEVYRRRIAIARAEKEPVTWLPSLGHDPDGRAAALADAVGKGRLAIEQARTSAGSAVGRLDALLGNGHPAQIADGRRITGRDLIGPGHDGMTPATTLDVSRAHARPQHGGTKA